MRGQVSQFLVEQGQGVIVGEDGRQYPFMGNHWHNARAPMAGDAVEFSVDSQGYAVRIQTTMSAPTASAVSLDKPVADVNPYQAPSQMGGVIASHYNGVNPLWAEEENYGFFDWVKKCLRNYANFNGRARRKEYWYFYLFFILMYILGLVIDSMLDTGGIVTGILMLALFLPNIAVGARRLHDINKSGWWMLISAIPLVGIIYLVWLATDTKPESNQWGAPARRV